ncbi:MAG: hypothetical protein EAZ89_17450 [Bacteroidetes bacterium]|nr:MAG: hypothetical protein EAZ89_17450 [Bacteroidota bacterium]
MLNNWMALLPMGEILPLFAMISPEKWGMYLSVALVASVKFLFGVLAGLALPGFTLWDILFSAGGGAFLGSVAFTFFGVEIQKLYERYFPRKKPASFARRRKLYVFWKRYGLLGVSVMIPVFSPMVSIAIAIAFRERPGKILLYITASIIVWSVLLFSFKELALGLFGTH